MIPHVIIGQKSTLILSITFAAVGAITGVSKANLLEQKINTTIDGINKFTKLCETMSKAPIK